MNETKKWYIAYTRPGHEKKVTESLSRKKIECYCPLNNIIHQPFYRKKTVPEVLFCSYSFVRICETQIPELTRVNGIINFVCWLNKPFIVPDQEIDVIREFLHEYGTVTMEKIGIDENARFPKNIPIDHKETGIFVTNSTATAILPSLGYVMTAEMKPATIEIPVPQLLPFLPRLRSIMDKIVG
ncbi:MAG TPA: transcription termination/antitermination NusG family protein [Chitinophagaceae bacterium]|jgi:transcription termination/antitermination protein NusG|nr:transcription termination/antitermination NusG family protein [Chitinophagaceae bacterium]